MIICEELEILALLDSYFNSHIQFILGELENLFIVCLHFLLTRNRIVKILAPSREICGANGKNFCQFIMKCHNVQVDVVASCGDW